MDLPDTSARKTPNGPALVALSCPTCSDRLTENEDGFSCQEGHRYTIVGLALATNIAALNALWMAIRALEDDAYGLEYMALRREAGSQAARQSEAAAARAAAATLRDFAHRAQQRLDALPVAPSAVTEHGSQRGRGG